MGGAEPLSRHATERVLMFRSVSQMNRASQPQRGAEAGSTYGSTYKAEEQDMGATVATDRSLEEMASDLRNLTGQVMTARVMGRPHGHADAGPGATPAVRLVG